MDGLNNKCNLVASAAGTATALCHSSVARDKLVLLRHLKRAEPCLGEKLASHIKDYYNNVRAR